MYGCVLMYWSVHLSTSMSTSGKKSLTLNSKPNSFYLTIIFPLSKISSCAPSTVPHRISHRAHLFSSLLIEMKWSSFPIPQNCILYQQTFQQSPPVAAGLVCAPGWCKHLRVPGPALQPAANFSPVLPTRYPPASLWRWQ